MKEVTAAFIHEVKSKGHLAVLLKGMSFILCIRTKDDILYIQFQNGDVEICPPDQNHTYDVLIAGSKDRISSILMGNEKLRSSIRAKNILVDSTFRRLLFLESLFLLSKQRVS
ncbi:hypothetical protein [Cytobacillus massiliigabonensis]|uniref:hypothetical protein n=1 Tax=Cytobacillus massiliigabonensis TaxID=1871011 RepID=UPI000C83CF55|nr:hypothetical protein [Cytobacillus massiliigabonensis]